MSESHITGLHNVPPSLRGCVLAIGNFDGVHLGHRRILSHVRSLADAAGAPAVAVTFDPPPDLVLRPDDAPQRLCPHAERVRLLRAAGADIVVTARPDAQMLGMEPGEFIERVIMARFAPRSVVEGPNFFFGRDRSGTVALLQSAGERLGFDVHVVEPVLADLPDGPQRISSTLIRRLVAEGRVEDAAAMLARPFALAGPVVRGQRVGRVLEYPTANIDPGEQTVPADGVYAARGDLDGVQYPAAVSIGSRPTFEPTDRAIEAHLLGAAGEFYGRALTLKFIRRLRGQEKFENPDALKRQIARDVRQTGQIMQRLENSKQ